MAYDPSVPRKAGKSDTEIAEYLGRELGYDISVPRKAGKSDTEIVEYLSKNDRPASVGKETQAKPVNPVEGGAPQRKTVAEITKIAKDGGIGAPQLELPEAADSAAPLPSSISLVPDVAKNGLSLLEGNYSRQLKQRADDEFAERNRQALATKGFRAASEESLMREAGIQKAGSDAAKKQKTEANLKAVLALRQRMKEKGYSAETIDAVASRQLAEATEKRKADEDWAAENEALKAEKALAPDRSWGETINDSWQPVAQSGLGIVGGGAYLLGAKDVSRAMLEESALRELDKSQKTQISNKLLEHAKFGKNLTETLVQDPLAIMDMVLQSAPMTLPGMGLGRAAAAVTAKRMTAQLGQRAASAARTRLLAQGADAGRVAGQRVVQKAAGKAATAGGVVGEAAVSGGMNGSQAEQQVREMNPIALQANSPRYRELLEQGMAPDAAQETLAQEVGHTTALLTALATSGGGVAAKYINGKANFEQTYSRAVGAPYTLQGHARGLAGESVEELMQNPLETMAGNRAQQAADDTVGLMDDVAKSAALGPVAAIGQSGATQGLGHVLYRARGGAIGDSAPVNTTQQSAQSGVADHLLNAANAQLQQATGGATAGGTSASPVVSPTGSVDLAALQAEADAHSQRSQEFVVLANEARALGDMELAAHLEAQSQSAAAQAKQSLDVLQRESSGLRGIVNRAAADGIGGLDASQGLDSDFLRSRGLTHLIPESQPLALPAPSGDSVMAVDEAGIAHPTTETNLRNERAAALIERREGITQRGDTVVPSSAVPNAKTSEDGIIRRHDGRAWADKAQAVRSLEYRGLQDSHEVVNTDDGFVIAPFSAEALAQQEAKKQQQAAAGVSKASPEGNADTIEVDGTTPDKPAGEQEMRKRMAYLRGAIAASGDDKFKASAKAELRELTNKINSLNNADQAAVSPEASSGAAPESKALTKNAVASHRLETAKAEILRDIASGKVPDTVRSFSELQDHVDANMYINDYDRPDRMIGPLGKQEGWGANEFADFTNSLVQSLDSWLSSGRVNDEVAKRKPSAQADERAKNEPKNEPKAAAAPKTGASPTGLNYPNRKLRLEFAKTEDGGDPNAWANIALANLQPGDVVKVGNDSLTVKSIGSKAVTFTKADGKTTRFDVDTPRMEKLVRDVASLLEASHHSSHGRDWVNILSRDPTFGRSNGVISLRDTEAEKPEVNAAPRTEDRRQSDDAPVRQVVLQNRNRSDAAYVQQMTSIAANPDAARLGFSRDFSSGAPVILQDTADIPDNQKGRSDKATTANGRKIPVQYAVVEADTLLPSNRADGTAIQGYDGGVQGKSRVVAGNGRSAGIVKAWQQGTATQYAEDVASDTDLHGIDPAVIQGMKQPVLVRLMSPRDVTANIGDESNDSGVAQKSAIENARDDARRVDLTALTFGEDGEITAESVRQFVRSMPISEQTGMLGRGGQPTTQAVDRLMGAIFHHAYGSDALTELFAQATDPDARNVLKGLAIAAPSMMQLNSDGIKGTDLDIRSLVAEAAQAVVNAQRRGQKLSEFLQQIDIDSSPEIVPILRMFAENSRSAKRMGDILQGAAEFAYDEATRDVSGGLFGDAAPRATKQQVLERIHDTARQENLGQQGGAIADGGDAQANATDTRTAGNSAKAQGKQQDSTTREQGQQGRVGTDDFALNAQTKEELAQREAEQQQAEAERQAREQKASQKAQADKDRNDFALTGSDSAIDEAEARGQGNMFDQRPTTRGERLQEGLIAIDDELNEALGELASALRDLTPPGQLNTLVDPVAMGRVLAVGMKASVLYLQKGAVKFAIWANNMIVGLEGAGIAPDVIKPYLSQLYLASKASVDKSIRSQMDGEDFVLDYDVSAIGSKSEEVQAPSPSAEPASTATGKWFGTRAKADEHIEKKQLSNTHEVVQVGQRFEIHEKPKQGEVNGSAELGEGSKGALAGVPAREGEASAGQRSAGGGAARGSQADAQGNDRAGESGLQGARSLGNDTREVSVPEAGSADGRAAGSAGSGPVRGSAGTDESTVAVGGLTAAVPATQLGADFAITDSDEVGAGGAKTKFKNNIAAIVLLKELEKQGRPATRDEQSILAKYVGWGGIPQAFARDGGAVTQGWERQVAELREVLTPDEYSAAAASTMNAHYTATEVVAGIWDAVQQFGFKGGAVLEPSVGTGNFFGKMPHGLRNASALVGVELDRITGGIAKLLYPAANIQSPMGFQDITIPDGHFDLAIGNPPFGATQIHDGSNPAINRMSIHNYFFAKSVLGLKPNGVLAMVVTNRMMDAGADRARQFIADRTEFLGAIRLPNDAFLKNAGTSVTTDIIFLRRLEEGEAATGESWTKVRDYTDKNGKTVPLNEYFHRNPDMMLGEFGAFGTMYREGDSALVARPGQDTMKLMQEAIKKLPSDFMPTVQRASTREVIAPVGDVDSIRVGSMFMQGDEIHVRMEDELGQQRSKPVVAGSAKSVERIKGMIAIRDALTTVRELQLSETSSEAAIAKARAKLNTVYDAFVKANGPINQDANKRLFRDDPTWPQISALEEGFDKGVSAAAAKATGLKQQGPSAKKAAIFTKRTQSPYRAPESAASAKDALVSSLSELGRVDLAYMSKLYGKDESEIAAELSGMIYQNPVRGWETSDEYLSGNVKQKLAIAEEAAKVDPQFDKNVIALRDVQPADIEAVDISVKLGAHWVPATDVAAFAKHITGDKTATAGYVSLLAKWTIDAKAASASIAAQWGTDRATIEEIITAAANQRTIQIKDKVSEDKYVVNEAATQAANEKVEAIKNEWARWLWSDDARRERLARQYNDTFNTDRQREYDGSHLTFPGKVGNDIIQLRPHQANAAWRILQSPTTLADHVVGAGKTFTLIAAAMEMRRMGRASKPMFVVPNHLVGQWAADFVKLYPGANVLAASKKDFDKENRKRMFARIATGDWDAVIVAHSSFGKIGVHPDFVAKFIRDQIADIEVSITATREAEGKSSRNVKQIEKQKAALEEKLKDLFAQKKKDDSLYFDELGIDALFVDEAHEFKNLQFSTSMTRIAGVPNSHSQKASDLFMKVQQVQQRTGGRNIVFATGTPISNSMAEMFTMQRYLDYKTMNDQGLAHFDAWARMYGEVVTDWELSPSGQYKMNSRFAKFVNMPELMQRYASFADVVNRDDINRMLEAQGKVLPVPKVKGGKPQNIIVERSAEQANYIGVASMDEYGNEQYPEGSLVWRSENLPKGAAAKEKGADNMLKIMSDARKAALDMRLIDPDAGDNPKSKVNEAADRMVATYHQWAADKGTQLVFIDLSTPKSAHGAEASRIRELIARAEDGDFEAQEALDKLSPDELDALNAKFDVYNDLRDKLIARGIPAEEIAFIHSANTDAKKEELFGKVRSGRVRFLFGSTAKMGAGMNVQERLVALHHLDAPWRPSDLEQREGRIIRQGNVLYDRDPEGFEVEINRYATKQTLDSRMWQTIEAKARFIEQVRKGATGGREVEDIAGEAANAAEMKAASSGNPLILEEMELRQKLRKMSNEESEHDRQQHRVRAEIRSIKNGMEASERLLVDTQADSRLVPASLAVTIKGKLIEKHKEAGAAILLAAAPSIMNMDARAEEVTVGEYGDFTIKVEKTAGDKEKFSLWLETSRGSYQVGTFSLDADPTGMAIRMANTVKQLPERAAELEARIAAQKADLPKLEAQIKPWPKAADLAAAKARHAGIIEKLKPKKADPAQADARAIVETTEESGRRIVREGRPAYDSGNAKSGFDNERKASNLQVESQRRSFSPEEQGTLDLFAPSGVPTETAREQSADNFLVHYVHEPVGRLSTGFTQIKTPEQAAHLFAPNRRHAQETMMAAVLDKDDNILHVIRHSKGLKDEASVSPVELVAGIAATKGAAKVWISHNHPSGIASPSGADYNITKRINSALDGTGIELAGHIVVGEGRQAHYFKDSLDSRGILVEPAIRNREASVTERIQRKRIKGEKLDSPSLARQFAQKLEARDAVILLNTQHQVVGTLAMSPREMSFLRDGKQVNRLLSAIDKANVSAIIVKASDTEAATNLARFINNLGDLRLLDVLYEVYGVLRSDAERGTGIAESRGEFYSKSEQWYFSPLTRAVEGMKQETALASQWRAMIEKAPGVKSDELEATGVIEWLQAAGGKVKKSDILDFLADKAVIVNDVMKGEKKFYPEGSLMHPATGEVQSREDWLSDFDPDYLMDEGLSEEEALGRLIDVAGDEVQGDDFSDTEYGKYTVPGGKNYREMLITLPENKDAPIDPADIPDEEPAFDPDDIETLPQQARRLGNYRSGHWDEANILAHVRFDERTDADGKRVLFINEIQSDWGQEGKKKGFQDEQAMREHKRLEDQVERLVDEVSKFSGSTFSEEFKELVAKKNAAILARDNHAKENNISKRLMGGASGVPTAPFVTKTDAWVSLAIKRMIRYAAENGFDRVVFINGQQAADLFDLSKQIDRVQYTKWSDGKVGVEVYDKKGYLVALPNHQADGYSIDELPDLLGKDIADKIANGDGQDVGNGRTRKLSGVDLKVGGEGMRTFYDRIVPKVAGDVIKKLGGGKLRKFNTGESAAKETGEFLESLGRKQEDGPANAGDNVSFDINPAMRDAALAGLPLFAKGENNGKLTKSALDKQLRSGLLGSFVGRMIDNGSIILHASSPARHADGAEGWTESDGTIHLVANALRPATVLPTLLHELFHRGNKAISGTKAHQKLMKGLESLYKQYKNAPEGSATNEFYKKAVRRVENAKTKEAHQVEEFGAYAITAFELAPRSVRKWVQEFIGSVKAWMLRRLGIQAGDITPSQLRAMAIYALKSDGRRRTKPITDEAGQATALYQQANGTTPYTADTIEVDGKVRPATNNKGQRIAQTEEGLRNFWRWFGDSKVVDADGRPLVVYHGTMDDIEAFEESKGVKADPGWLGRGFYFTTNPDTARYYAVNGKVGYADPNVLPVYLKIENPYAATVKDKESGAVQSFGGKTDYAIARRNELKDQGFDGVMLDFSKGGYAKEQELVAFDPTQIKSVNNRGTFDPADPNILYQSAYSYTEVKGPVQMVAFDPEQVILPADDGLSQPSRMYSIAEDEQSSPYSNDSEFHKETRRLREKDKTAWSKARNWWKRNFYAGGLLPDGVYDEKIKRDGAFNAIEHDVTHLTGMLTVMVKKEYGKDLNKLSVAEKELMADALAGKWPGDTVKLETRATLLAMRRYIDSLSGEYTRYLADKVAMRLAINPDLNLENDADARLLETITGNIGSYVHRSYRAFDDKNWYKEVPESVIDDAMRYLMGRHIENGETEAEARRRAEVAINEIIKTGTAYDSMDAFIAEGKLGAKDLSILIKRKEIAPEIRALLGEYKDPRLNFAKSATKMARLVWNQRLLDRVRDIGLGTFLFTDDTKPANATVQIAGESSEVYAPLNGLWTTPEIAQAFKDILGKDQLSDLMRHVVAFNAAVKYGKTVLSPTTAMRNIQSSLFFTVANGHFDYSKVSKAIEAFKEQVLGKTGDAYMRRMLELGVTYDTPNMDELKQWVKESGYFMANEDAIAPRKWLSKLNERVQGFYRFGDDFWKIIGFENEKAVMLKAGMPLAEAEARAAERIRNTYPTYSMIGRGTKWLSRFPLVGTFVSFPAEIIRTSGHIFKYMAQDIRSNNKQIRAMGARKLVGAALVSGGFYALSALTKAAFDMDDDDEEVIRVMAPEWSKNSTFLFWGRNEKTGQMEYTDLSFIDPYGYWKRPITAMMRDQPWDEALASGMRDMLAPFFSWDITTNTILEVIRNKKASGSSVYDETASRMAITGQVSEHIAKSLSPGFIGNIQRIYSASKDEKKATGQPYVMKDEMMALVGWRHSTTDPRAAIRYRAMDYLEQNRIASGALNRVLREQNTLSDERIVKAVGQSVEAKQRIYKDMSMVIKAAMKSGMDDIDVEDILRAGSISKDAAISLTEGEMPEVKLSMTSIKRAVQAAEAAGDYDRVDELYRRYDVAQDALDALGAKLEDEQE